MKSNELVRNGTNKAPDIVSDQGLLNTDARVKIQELQQILDHPDQFESKKIQSLVQIALDDPDPAVRRAGVKVISYTSLTDDGIWLRKQAVGKLLALRKDRVKWVRYEANKALHQLLNRWLNNPDASHKIMAWRQIYDELKLF